MITFKESKELFGDETIVVVTCKWLPECFKMPIRIKESLLPEWKLKTEKQILLMLTEKMLQQRFQNYNHSGTQYQSQFTELQNAREKLEQIKNSPYEKFIQVYKEKIIRVLHFVNPPYNSPLYANFSEKITDIENYLNSKNHV